jgi:hypothetical protein
MPEKAFPSNQMVSYHFLKIDNQPYLIAEKQEMVYRFYGFEYKHLKYDKSFIHSVSVSLIS